MNNKRIVDFVLLHLLLLLYSVSDVFSKKASAESFFSFNFALCYSVVIIVLFAYAIGWQKVIKRLPLTTAYASKAVTIVWGLFWGKVVFDESITLPKVVGVVVVMAGVVLFAVADRKQES